MYLSEEREEHARLAKEAADAKFREPRKSHESSLGGISLNRLTEALDRHDKARSGGYDAEEGKKVRLTTIGRNLSMVSDGKVITRAEQEQLARFERDRDADSAAGLKTSKEREGKGSKGSGSKAGGGSKNGSGGGFALSLEGPLAAHAPLTADEYASKNVQYERGSVIYYGSHIALRAKLHGGYLCMNGTRGCMASAPGLQPHALFTVWNINELTSVGALRYGDSVWLQCGSHELLGSSVLMQDLGDLVEAAVNDYHVAIDEIHNRQAAGQALASGTGWYKKKENFQTLGSNLHDKKPQPGESKNEDGGGPRAVTKLRDKPTPDILHSGFHVVGGKSGEGPARIVGQHMSKSEEKYQGRLVSLHCAGDFLKRAKHAGRWVLMNRADPLGTLGMEVCHLDDVVIEQEWLYLASKNPDRAGLKHGASIEALHERQKVGSVARRSTAAAAPTPGVNSEQPSESQAQQPQSTQTPTQTQTQTSRETTRDAPERRVPSECVWTVHMAKQASSSNHEVQGLSLATHAQKQLEASRAHRTAVERGVSAIQKEKYLEAQKMTLEHMHGPDSRAIGLVDHLRRSYHSRASRGWHNDAPLLSTESLAEVYGPASIFARAIGDAEDEAQRQIERAYVRPPDIKRVNERERARILASLAGLESGIKSEHHMALTYESTKNHMSEQMKRVRAAHMVLRAWRRFQTFKWKRVLGDADNKMIFEVRQEKIDKAKREKMNQTAAEAEQNAWKTELDRSKGNGAEMPSASSMRRIMSMSRLTSLDSKYRQKGSFGTTISTAAAFSPTAQHHQELTRRLSSKRMSSSAMRLSSPKISLSSNMARSARAGSGSAGENMRRGSRDRSEMNDLDDYLQNAASPVEDEEGNESTREATEKTNDDSDSDSGGDYDERVERSEESSLTYGEYQFQTYEELVHMSNGDRKAAGKSIKCLSDAEKQLVEELGLSNLSDGDLELTDEERLRFLADENPSLFGGFRTLNSNVNPPAVAVETQGEGGREARETFGEQEGIYDDLEDDSIIDDDDDDAVGGLLPDTLLLEPGRLSPNNAVGAPRPQSAPRQVYTGARHGLTASEQRRVAVEAAADLGGVFSLTSPNVAEVRGALDGGDGYDTPRANGDDVLPALRARPQSASAVSAAKQQQRRRLELSMPTSPAPAGPSTAGPMDMRLSTGGNANSPMATQRVGAPRRQRPQSAGPVASARPMSTTPKAMNQQPHPQAVSPSPEMFANPRWKPKSTSAIYISSTSREAIERNKQMRKEHELTGGGGGCDKPKATTLSAPAMSRGAPRERHKAFQLGLEDRRRRQQQKWQQHRHRQLQEMAAVESISATRHAISMSDLALQAQQREQEQLLLQHHQRRSVSAGRLHQRPKSAEQRGRFVHRKKKLG